MRALALARRPLYWLSMAVGLLVLIALGAFAVVLFQTAVEQCQTTLTDRVLESNHFAAEFGAATAAREIELRWKLLQVTADEEFFQDRVRAATEEESLQGKAHQELQKYLDEMLKGLTRALGRRPDSLFVTDPWGEQLARSPPAPGKTVGANFAHRDYFHGLGHDLERGTESTQPISDVHLSIVYRSEADQRLRVSFTVPIWSEGPQPRWFQQLGAALAVPGLGPVPLAGQLALPVEGRSAQPGDPRWPWLGVLGLSLEPGHFIELHPPGTGGDQVAVLIDTRADAIVPEQPGLILQHPRLDRFREAHPDSPPIRIADSALLETNLPFLRLARSLRGRGRPLAGGLVPGGGAGPRGGGRGDAVGGDGAAAGSNSVRAGGGIAAPPFAARSADPGRLWVGVRRPGFVSRLGPERDGPVGAAPLPAPAGRARSAVHGPADAAAAVDDQGAVQNSARFVSGRTQARRASEGFEESLAGASGLWCCF